MTHGHRDPRQREAPARGPGRRGAGAAALSWALAAGPALADPAEIVAAEAERAGEGWRVSVTIRHADTGWDDYADGWRVIADGEVVGTRTLAHPHVEEQPFTRSLSGMAIPEGAGTVEVEASTSVTGWGGERRGLDLSGPSGGPASE